MYDLCVVGLGKLGLPLSVYFASKNANVIGLDLNAELVMQINQGQNPIRDEKDLSNYLETTLQSENFRATTKYEEAIPYSRVIIVVVPLFIDRTGNPDFSLIDSAMNSIGRNLTKGSLIIIETTLPIGTTRGRLAKILRESSKLEIGIDFFLAFSPERVLTGRVFEDLEKYPKIVGGYCEESGKLASDFYRKYIDFAHREDLSKGNGVWLMKDSSVAEFVKLAETTYRDVNIALANTFSNYAHEIGVDVQDVIEASNSQMFSHIHDPGISVGGHCIPVYPHLYLSNHNSANLVRVAREINYQMPLEYVRRLEKKTQIIGEKILVYGLAYRPKVKESYHSGTFELVKNLESRNAEVFVHDPLYSSDELYELGLMPFNESDASRITLLILHTHHEEFQDFMQEQNWGKLRIILLGRKVSDANFLSQLSNSITIL